MFQGWNASTPWFNALWNGTQGLEIHAFENRPMSNFRKLEKPSGAREDVNSSQALPNSVKWYWALTVCIICRMLPGLTVVMDVDEAWQDPHIFESVGSYMVCMHEISRHILNPQQVFSKPSKVSQIFWSEWIEWTSHGSTAWLTKWLMQN